jgi:hypothetical protein
MDWASGDPITTIRRRTPSSSAKTNPYVPDWVWLNENPKTDSRTLSSILQSKVIIYFLFVHNLTSDYLAKWTDINRNYRLCCYGNKKRFIDLSLYLQKKKQIHEYPDNKPKQKYL